MRDGEQQFHDSVIAIGIINCNSKMYFIKTGENFYFILVGSITFGPYT